MTGTSGAPHKATFTEGSILRHVVVMTATGSVGLMAIFVVDLVNLLYISFLGEDALTAAMGYAGTILFVLVSVGIGCSIATTALTARAIGAGDRPRARRVATSGLVATTLLGFLLVLLILPFTESFIAVMGADGRTLAVAVDFLHIALFGMPLLSLSMSMSGVLMANGDPRRAMYVTLSGAVATALLDPIFIFAMGLGTTGAAIVTVLVRFVTLAVAWNGAVRRHDLLARPSAAALAEDIRPLAGIALPAILTNLATPVSSMIVTAAVAPFGTAAVAGWAIVGRIFPLAFAGIFALSGSVGAIFGQNYGARRFDRLRLALVESLKFVTVYVLAVWLVLALGAGFIAWAFHAEAGAADMITFFCRVVAPAFIFTGALFVANAAFNNLGYPTHSTLFNWGRATLGTWPFCWLGGRLMGADGVILGYNLGAGVFGLLAVAVAFSLVGRMQRRHALAAQAEVSLPAAAGGAMERS